jgi:choline kinase
MLILVLDRHYKTVTFASQLLEILNLLRVSGWSSSKIAPQSLNVQKVTGALTNSVFFVSSSVPRTPTLLLRIYGSSSETLISHARELHTLLILSSQYHFGPKVYGTFANGRIEEYFDSVALTPLCLRDSKTSRWIGARMAELHTVDLDVIERHFSKEGNGSRTGVERNVKSWLPPARDVLALTCVSDASRKEFDLDGFERTWARYLRWISKMEEIDGPSKRVFSHNDTQYGNLLRLRRLADGTPEHRQVSDG